MGDKPHETIHQNSNTIRDLRFKTMAKARECLEEPQYFLSSGFRIGRRSELTSKLKVEANPVNLKIRILQASRRTVKTNRGKVTQR